MLLYAEADSELKETLPIEALKQVVYFIIKSSPTLCKHKMGICACVTFRTYIWSLYLIPNLGSNLKGVYL
jgi:hypothetical protein